MVIANFFFLIKSFFFEFYSSNGINAKLNSLLATSKLGSRANFLLEFYVSNMEPIVKENIPLHTKVLDKFTSRYVL